VVAKPGATLPLGKLQPGRKLRPPFVAIRIDAATENDSNSLLLNKEAVVQLVRQELSKWLNALPGTPLCINGSFAVPFRVSLAFPQANTLRLNSYELICSKENSDPFDIPEIALRSVGSSTEERCF
jgi:hypothetical protein